MSRFYIQSRDFDRHVQRMKSFRTGWRGAMRRMGTSIAEDIIEQAREEKPDLAGRTGRLNMSWTFTPPRHTGGALKFNVMNLAPYALTVEEGLKNPKPRFLRGRFDTAFRTGHNLPMFFPSSGEGTNVFFMPTKPWEGFFMLETALEEVEGRLQTHFDRAFYDLAHQKGLW